MIKITQVTISFEDNPNTNVKYFSFKMGKYYVPGLIMAQYYFDEWKKQSQILADTLAEELSLMIEEIKQGNFTLKKVDFP